MAPKAPRTKKIGQKSITERLDNFAQDPDAEPELLEESRSAWDRAKQSYGFDKASTLTQNRRKRHLAEYENFLTGVAKKEGKEVDDEYLWGKWFDSFLHC